MDLCSFPSIVGCVRWAKSTWWWDPQSCRGKGRLLQREVLGLNIIKVEAMAKQVKAPRTAAAEKKDCSLHLQGLGRVETCFQEVEGEVLLQGIPSRWRSLSPCWENASDPQSGGF